MREVQRPVSVRIGRRRGRWSFPALALLTARALAFAPALALAMAALGLASPVAAGESQLIEEPPAKSVEDASGSLERSLEAPPAPEPARFPQVRRALEGLPPFLRDSQLGVDFRTYYFRSRSIANRDTEAAAIGGALRYQSGWLLDRLQVGATLFTSQKLYGPPRRDGTGLLARGQNGYTALGEAFIRLRAGDHALTGYRQSLSLPYLNGNDSRMTPNTFEGVTLSGRHSALRYALGHLFEMKLRNDDQFISFSEAARVPDGGNRGLSFAGVQINPLEGLSFGAINHFVRDTLNTAYTEIDWFRERGEDWGVRLGAQFTHQRSVGDDRLTADSFETWVVGGRVTVSFRQAVLSVAMSVTDDDQQIRNPWGSYPGFLGMMQRNFNEANEKAWGISASWYLGLIGLPDLSVALRYTEGYDGLNVTTGTDIGRRQEFNSTFDYRLRTGPLQGLWLRARFAWGHGEDARRDSLETRLILRYEFQAL